MVVLTAYMDVIPDKLGPALEACRTVRTPSLLEPGCERYDFFQSPDDGTKIVFVEEWTSKADLDRHFEQAAFLNFRSATAGFLRAPAEVRIFESSLVS